MELLLASGNAHKAEEFASLFDPSIIQVKAAPKKLEVLEDGQSYFENAYKKAAAYFAEFKVPVLADDSGLNVTALPDELGITSARFGGEGLSDKERAVLLLEKMQNQKERSAYFSCVLCIYLNDKEIFYFEGRMNGSIAHVYRGSGGFGYDPVFVPTEAPESLTLAELSDWKAMHSHWALASSLAQKFFANRA